MKEKLVIIINGKGGVGKDFLCDSISEKYKTKNISAITPIKKIASVYGWNGEKDDKSRRFLSELKRVFADYNDLPNQYLLKEYNAFLKSDEQILFVHIREKDQIQRFSSSLCTKYITLLVRRKSIDNQHQYGNSSDDNVADLLYDYYFDNDLDAEKSAIKFRNFIDEIWNNMFT